MISLPKFSIKRPVCIFLCVVSLFVFGLSAVLGMPLESTPAIEMPILMIFTTYRNATPEEVDSMVTDVIENSLANITEIADTYSSSSQSTSMVMMQFNYGVDLDKKYTDVDSAMSMARLQLPDDCDAPVLMELNIQNLSNSSIMMLSVQADASDNTKAYIEDTVVPELERIEGVADVAVSGGARKYIQVLLDEDRLSQYGLNISSIASAIGSAEYNISMGSLNRGDISVAMLGSAKIEDYLDIENIPITLASGNVIHISDVASVSMRNESGAGYNRTDGKESISLTISKNQSANTVDICDDVVKVVDTINAGSLGVKLNVTYNSGQEIKNNLKDVALALLEGLVIAMAVLWIFLGDWKASLIIGTSMPISVFVALALMSAFDMSLNIISLGGLLIGIGMLVDNSIVVIDSCFQAQHDTLRTFEDRVTAGADLVVGAIVSSTLTTIVVFLPVGLMQGMAGQFFKDICYTIVFSLTASLLSAITLVPLLFVRLHPVEKEESLVARTLHRVEAWYGALLKKLLNKRKTVVCAALAMLILAAVLFGQLDMELIADSSTDQLTLNIEMRNGLDVDASTEVLKSVESIIAAEPDVASYTISGGSSGITSMMMGGGGASVRVTLKEGASRTTDEFVSYIREKTARLPNCAVTATAAQSLSLTATTVQVMLQGKDLDDMRDAAESVRAVMAAMPEFDAVTTSLADGAPQAEIHVDPVLAGAVGLTPMSVLSSVRGMLSGMEAMTYTQDNTEYSVKVEYPEGRFADISDLYGLLLTSPYGSQVPLMDVAAIEYSASPQSLTRMNGEYLITITGTPKVGLNVNNMTTLAMQKVREQVKLPSGVTFAEGTDIQTMMEEFQEIGKALLIAIYLVFVVMAIQFESLRFSLIVMISVPFSLTGAFLGLFITNSTINMASLLGVIMLCGIVVNNAIVLIDYTNILRREQGLSAPEALVASGTSRLRPILMTTLTTVCGLLPMAIGSGVEMMQSLGVVVIFGLMFSTILTLILIPTFYLMFDREERQKRKAAKKAKRAQKRRGRKGRKGAEASLETEDTESPQSPDDEL